MNKISIMLMLLIVSNSCVTTSGNKSGKTSETYTGLKHTIGVLSFNNQAGWRGRWDLGFSLASMMESALYDTGHFVLVDRQNLSGVLAEQNLKKSGRSKGAKDVAESGRLRAAKYLVSGVISEVEENELGGSGGVRIKRVLVGGGLARTHIAAIIKIVDSTTGEIVAKERVTGKAGRQKLRLGYFGAEWGTTLGGFHKTPLGEAAQDLVVQASDFIVKKFEDYDFEGSVVKMTENGQVIINRGTKHGVQVGQQFIVKEEGELLLDPDTGEVLEDEEGLEIATIKAGQVKEKVTYCEITSGKPPPRGSIVRQK